MNSKSKASSIQIDIIDFYPSISENLLENSLNFTKNYIGITDDELKIITASRQSVLIFHDFFNENFDFPMGAFDSAQIAD